MQKRVFSVLSAVFCFLTFSPLIAMPNDWGEQIFIFITEITIYLPFVLGVLGIFFALVGVKGEIKAILFILNTLGLIVYLFIFLMGLYGFQEP